MNFQVVQQVKAKNFKNRLGKLSADVAVLQKLSVPLIAARHYALRRLSDLELPEKIWMELTPQVSMGIVIFGATEKAKKVLGPVLKSNSEEWTSWEAAQLVSAVETISASDDPKVVAALSYFVGSVVGERSDEIIRKSSGRRGQKKKGYKSDFSLLIEWAFKRLKNPDKDIFGVLKYLEQPVRLAEFHKSHPKAKIGKFKANWKTEIITFTDRHEKPQKRRFATVRSKLSRL